MSSAVKILLQWNMLFTAKYVVGSGMLGWTPHIQVGGYDKYRWLQHIQADTAYIGGHAQISQISSDEDGADDDDDDDDEGFDDAREVTLAGGECERQGS